MGDTAAIAGRRLRDAESLAVLNLSYVIGVTAWGAIAPARLIDRAPVRSVPPDAVAGPIVALLVGALVSVAWSRIRNGRWPRPSRRRAAPESRYSVAWEWVGVLAVGLAGRVLSLAIGAYGLLEVDDGYLGREVFAPANTARDAVIWVTAWCVGYVGASALRVLVARRRSGAVADSVSHPPGDS